MRRKLIILFCLTTLAIVLTACGNKDEVLQQNIVEQENKEIAEEPEKTENKSIVEPAEDILLNETEETETAPVIEIGEEDYYYYAVLKSLLKRQDLYHAPVPLQEDTPLQIVFANTNGSTIKSMYAVLGENLAMVDYNKRENGIYIKFIPSESKLKNIYISGAPELSEKTFDGKEQLYYFCADNLDSFGQRISWYYSFIVWDKNDCPTAYDYLTLTENASFPVEADKDGDGIIYWVDDEINSAYSDKDYIDGALKDLIGELVTVDMDIRECFLNSVEDNFQTDIQNAEIADAVENGKYLAPYIQYAAGCSHWNPNRNYNIYDFLNYYSMYGGQNDFMQVFLPDYQLIGGEDGENVYSTDAKDMQKLAWNMQNKEINSEDILAWDDYAVNLLEDDKIEIKLSTISSPCEYENYVFSVRESEGNYIVSGITFLFEEEVITYRFDCTLAPNGNSPLDGYTVLDLQQTELFDTSKILY